MIPVHLQFQRCQYLQYQTLKAFFEDAKVIKLEQNYRSREYPRYRQQRHFQQRGERTSAFGLTRAETGLPFEQLESGFEGSGLCGAFDISEAREKGVRHASGTVLCFTEPTHSPLWRLFEKFIAANIPYKIVGGVNFYAVKEIKDILHI